MNTQPSSGLQTCPDCGGILEQPQSYLASTIAVVSPSLDTLDQEIGAWLCPLCGYQCEPSAPTDDDDES